MECNFFFSNFSTISSHKFHTGMSFVKVHLPLKKIIRNISFQSLDSGNFQNYINLMLEKQNISNQQISYVFKKYCITFI